LLEKGAEVEAGGGEPLRWAVIRRNRKMVSLLLRRGASPKGLKGLNWETIKEIISEDNYFLSEKTVSSILDSALLSRLSKRRGKINSAAAERGNFFSDWKEKRRLSLRQMRRKIFFTVSILFFSLYYRPGSPAFYLAIAP